MVVSNRKLGGVCMGMRLRRLSLIPRREEGGGGKERLVSTVCACALISKKFLENRITSGHLRYTDLCEVADFYCVEDAYHSHAV